MRSAAEQRDDSPVTQKAQNETPSDRTHAPGVPPVFNPGLSAGAPSTELKAQNEPNSDLTSISEITYNRSRREKAKRNDPSQTNLTNPDDQPGRSDNKQPKRPAQNPPK